MTVEFSVESRKTYSSQRRLSNENESPLGNSTASEESLESASLSSASLTLSERPSVSSTNARQLDWNATSGSWSQSRTMLPSASIWMMRTDATSTCCLSVIPVKRQVTAE